MLRLECWRCEDVSFRYKCSEISLLLLPLILKALNGKWRSQNVFEGTLASTRSCKNSSGTTPTPRRSRSLYSLKKVKIFYSYCIQIGDIWIVQIDMSLLCMGFFLISRGGMCILHPWDGHILAFSCRAKILGMSMIK